jgi:hypothetical protein
MSAWLDDHRELAGLVAADLRRYGAKATGRQGLPAEAVLRCAVLKQHRQLSYRAIRSWRSISASFRAFARLPHGWSPQKSVLHQTISAIWKTSQRGSSVWPRNSSSSRPPADSRPLSQRRSLALGYGSQSSIRARSVPSHAP